MELVAILVCMKCEAEIATEDYVTVTIHKPDMSATVNLHGLKCLAQWLQQHKRELHP